MTQCSFCGRSDQPQWHDASGARCQDGPACEAYRRQRGKTALRDPAGKPSARRSGPPAPDSEKAAHFAAKGVTGGTAPVTAPVTLNAPVAAPIRRRTAEMILNGEEYHDDPTPSGAKSTGISAAAAGAWLRLESAVESGNIEAMNAALLAFCEVANIDLAKAHRLTATQILNGEVLPYEGPRYKRGGPTAEQILNGEGAAHKGSVTVTGDDDADEDAEDAEDETEAGAAPNLALTADQAYYWERLQAVVSGSGGISDSLETAARNFYNSCSIGILAGT